VYDTEKIKEENMAFVFRKSINLGPLRINFSKNGIGWSWGVPGYRRSVSATGKKRTTYSIPGTGMSWSKTDKAEPKTKKVDPKTVKVNKASTTKTTTKKKKA
jgi:hypothetical protein